MSEPTDQVRRLCDEFGIRITHKHLYPKPGETRACATIQQIIDRHGEDHARLVLSALSETRGNGALLDQFSMWAMSDLLVACAEDVEERIGDVLDLLDQLPLGRCAALANELRGIVPQRHALVGMLYLLMRRSNPAPQPASRPIETRANASEHEKGRLPGYRAQPKRTIEQKVELGRELLVKRAEIGNRQNFLRWAIVEKDITPDMALNCMRMAREADQAGPRSSSPHSSSAPSG